MEKSTEVDVRLQSLLSGRKGLVVGIANEHGIDYAQPPAVRAPFYGGDSECSQS